MEYHVELTQRAQRDIEDSFAHIAADAPQAAITWRFGIEEKIDLLRLFPMRCGLAPEDRYRDDTIRQTFYGSYRMLFLIHDRTVYVVHVRHGARRQMTRNEVEQL